MNRFSSCFVVLSTALTAAVSVAQGSLSGSEHRYTFGEGSGNVARDAAGAAPGTLGPEALWTGDGAVRFLGNAGSYVNWERLLGQFGTDEFAVSFRLRVGRDRKLQEVLGNRSTYGHGNFFQVRVNDGLLVAEIDQDEEGTNYAAAVSRTRVNDGRWHRVRVARHGRRLTLEIDGKVESTGEGRGVANVRNAVPFRAGTSAVAEIYGGFLQGELDDLTVTSGSMRG